MSTDPRSPENDRDPAPFASPVDSAHWHLERASYWARIADDVLEEGAVLTEEEQRFFSYNTHMASIHSQIASASAVLAQATAAQEFPPLLRDLQEGEQKGVVVNKEKLGVDEDDLEGYYRGFDAAQRQGIGGDRTHSWAVNQLGPILTERLGGTIRHPTLLELAEKLADSVMPEEIIHTDPRPDSERGIYGKYKIEHLHDPEGKHDQCRYFVLDPAHDPDALAGLKAYERSATFVPGKAKLVKDLRVWIEGLEK